MIDRISGRAFESEEELDKFLSFLEELKEREDGSIFIPDGDPPDIGRGIA